MSARNIVLVSNIVEANGKTVRENNLSLKHKIPLNTLVEIDLDYSEYHGLRLRVVEHGRDCDGEPLYSLSFKRAEYFYTTGDPQIDAWKRGSKFGGFSDSCLRVIETV